MVAGTALTSLWRLIRWQRICKFWDKIDFFSFFFLSNGLLYKGRGNTVFSADFGNMLNCKPEMDFPTSTAKRSWTYATPPHSASGPGTQGRVDTRRVVSLLRWTMPIYMSKALLLSGQCRKWNVFFLCSKRDRCRWRIVFFQSWSNTNSTQF